MKITAGKETSLLLLFLIIPLILTEKAAGELEKEVNNGGKAEEKQMPSLAERAIGITGGLNSRWDSLKNWAKLAWINYKPPDAGFAESGSGAEMVKEAATKSFETSKETAEKIAVSAAKTAGDAVDMTKEKVKRTISSSEEPDDAEL